MIKALSSRMVKSHQKMAESWEKHPYLMTIWYGAMTFSRAYSLHQLRELSKTNAAKRRARR